MWVINCGAEAGHFNEAENIGIFPNLRKNLFFYLAATGFAALHTSYRYKPASIKCCLVKTNVSPKSLKKPAENLDDENKVIHLLYYNSSTVMFFKPNASSGVPIYLQVKEQIIHAIEKGAIQPGQQLPSVRTLSEQLVMNPNTVIKIYRELEMEGIIDIRHGSGAFVSEGYFLGTKAHLINQGTAEIQKLVTQLMNKGITAEEIRRMMEACLIASQGAGRKIK